jgi:probable rRNA maturation factor
MSVLIDNRQEFIAVDDKMEAYVERVVNGVLEAEECEEDYEVSISFVSNDEIRDLNREYRNINRATDVLSFPMLEYGEEEETGEEPGDKWDYDPDENVLLLGDIVISLERTTEQAEEYGHSFERELAFLTAHGIFHLLGYDHELPEDEKEMREKEEKSLMVF